jgi:hypothetical protein
VRERFRSHCDYGRECEVWRMKKMISDLRHALKADLVVFIFFPFWNGGNGLLDGPEWA